ncbi:MAG: Asp23/Gls24 family envelope stress response protein [Clostridiales Family XIII bacterium]|jgi:uncharacterized alkaline shock family protein YloU|nr:Asp23/Gls24 family envelope stress response protein [Clostridiales Family XIII bacterium]
MLYEEQTGRGRISYNEPLVGSIVRHAVRTAANGRALPSDSKGRLLKTGRTQPAAADDGFITANFDEDGLNITCHIIIRFGSSLSGTSAQIDTEVRKAVRTVLGVYVDRLAIVVTGVLAKNLSRRNLMFVTYKDGARQCPPV